MALVSLIGVGSLIGRFTVGAPADRLGRLPSLCAMYAGLGLMFLLWTVASAYWMLVVFAVVFGACYGAYVALLPTIVMDLYGPRSVSGIIGCLYTGCGVGTLLGPWLAGVAYDAWAATSCAILGGALFSVARRGLRRDPDARWPSQSLPSRLATRAACAACTSAAKRSRARCAWATPMRSRSTTRAA